jgi:hypothetical protein
VGERVVVFDSPATGERYEVDLPLTAKLDPVTLRDELGLPSYIDARESHVERALGVLWAARRADVLAGEHPELAKIGRPLDICLFGGVGYRFVCPSANDDPVFRRQPGDLDVITSRSDGHFVVTLFSALGNVLGDRYWHVVTKSDEMFNNLRGGRRFRVHGIEDGEEGLPGLTSLDILVERISFCHTVNVEDAFDTAVRSLFTIGSARLLLTKLQFIKAVDDSEEAAGHKHRVIGHLNGKLLIGPEDKDIADVAALLHDRGVGEADLQVNPDVLIQLLSADWGLAETVSLNSANKASFDHVLESRGAAPAAIDRVRSELAILAEVVEKARKRTRRPRLRLSKTWWEDVEDVG